MNRSSKPSSAKVFAATGSNAPAPREPVTRVFGLDDAPPVSSEVRTAVEQLAAILESLDPAARAAAFDYAFAELSKRAAG